MGTKSERTEIINKNSLGPGLYDAKEKEFGKDCKTVI